MQGQSALVAEVLAVMHDGARIDRYLARGADGQLYLTTLDTTPGRKQYLVIIDDSGTADEFDATETIEAAEASL